MDVIPFPEARDKERVERAVVREEDSLPAFDPEQVRMPGAEKARRKRWRHFAAERPKFGQELLCAMDELHGIQCFIVNKGFTWNLPVCFNSL